MTTSASSFDIAIHGAGFVGRTLALLLALQDLRVALIADETKSAVAKDIRAFSLNPASKDVLERVHAWPLGEAVTPVYCMEVFGDAGGELVFDDAGHAPDAALNWIVDVPALEAVLKEQVSREPRVACLTEGDALEAKLHVVCEGRTSRMVNKLGITMDTIRYPQHAVAARLICELPHDNAARQWFTERGEVLALLPMQGREVALVWSLESERAKEMLIASDTDFTTLLEASCHKALGAMTLASHRALWPLMLTRMKPWTGGSASMGEQGHGVWVLAGDAAHAMHPLAGQGLNAGLGDAALLAQTLKDVQGDSPLFHPTQTQLTRALRSYARARQAAIAPMVGVTDGLHLLFARDSNVFARARNLGMSWLNRASSIKKFLIKQAQ